MALVTFHLVTYRQNRGLDFIVVADEGCTSEKEARSKSAAIRKSCSERVKRVRVVEVSTTSEGESLKVVSSWTWLERRGSWTNDINTGTVGMHSSFKSR